MAKRRVELAEKEYYHIYNRGVDKRVIFEDIWDVNRFFQSMLEFNSEKPIGSLYENSFLKEKQRPKPLVSFVVYCLNPNHFHFILTPVAPKGIELFMHRLGTGYTMYFNKKNRRTGSLFQGNFKSSHINSNERLLRLSAYVNLNDKVHQLGGEASKLVRSSWNEYLQTKTGGLCDKKIILGQFKNTSDYKNFALSALPNLIEQKKAEKELQTLLID